MPTKSSNTTSSNSSNSSKLSGAYLQERRILATRSMLQIFYLDEKGQVMASCQTLVELIIGGNIFEQLEALEPFRAVIQKILQEKNELHLEEINLAGKESELLIDISCSYQSDTKLTECVLKNLTHHYQKINGISDSYQAQEIEHVNDKLALNQKIQILEVTHQKDLQQLNEQLRLDWTNSIAKPLKTVLSELFVLNPNHLALSNLSEQFEEISGMTLIPDPKKLSDSLFEKNILYLGNQNSHSQLIEKITSLMGGKLHKDWNEKMVFDFVFIEYEEYQNINNSRKAQLEKAPYQVILKEENLSQVILSDTNTLIRPLYPSQVWQQLQNLNQTNTMSYQEKIDLTAIYDMVDNEPMLVQSMLQILDKNLVEYPPKIREEFEAGKLEDLRQTIHKFKSCTAYTGLHQFNKTLSEVEASQENGWTIAQIEDKLNYILQAIPVIKVQVEQKLGELEQQLS